MFTGEKVVGAFAETFAAGGWGRGRTGEEDLGVPGAVVAGVVGEGEGEVCAVEEGG